MPASRTRTLVPVLLLLVVAAVVGGLLLGGAGDDDTAQEPAATTGPGETPAAVDAEADVEADVEADAEADAEAPAQAPDLTRRVEGDPMALGPVDAPVGVVVYSDYGCPYCQQWAHESQPTVVEYAQEGAVRLEVRDVSILGEDSARAAVAAAAAAEQDSYWEYHELLFADLEARSSADLTAMAGQLGLDLERFAADVTDEAVLATVQQNVDEAQAVGLQSTPSFLVGGTPVVGAQPAEVFVELIETALAD